MKFSCRKDILAAALLVAERFVGKNAALPVLGGLLLEASHNTLVVTATNLEHAIQIHVRGSAEREGKVSVPARLISSLIQSTKEETVELEEGKGYLLIKTGARKTRMNTFPVEEFPLIPKVKKIQSAKLENSLFSSGLERVLPAVSLSGFKPELSGVYIQVFPKEVRLAATDTARLAQSVLPVAEGPDQSFAFILPQRIAQEISRLRSEGEITITFGENQVLFSLDTIQITSRIIDGAFPEYRAVIPTQFETSCHVNRAELVDAIRISGLFASKLQDVALRFADSRLIATSTNVEIGENTATLAAECAGKEVEVRFNYRYLLDGLSTLAEDQIFIGCNKETSPALFRDKSDTSFVYILMPLRLS